MINIMEMNDDGDIVRDTYNGDLEGAIELISKVSTRTRVNITYYLKVSGLYHFKSNNVDFFAMDMDYDLTKIIANKEIYDYNIKLLNLVKSFNRNKKINEIL